MNDDSPEEWRPVAGFEGSYEVSSQGRVRSLDREVTQEGYTRRLRGRILRSKPGHGGYHGIALSTQTKYRHVRIHRLVAETFLGTPDSEDLEVCHFDGDPSNNRVENLRWDTRSANQVDRVRHGRHNHADKTHCKNGHEFTPENTAITDRTKQRRGTSRVCIQCQREASRHSEARRLAALYKLRDEFLRLLTEDGHTADRRLAAFNEAVFDAESGAGLGGVSLEVVMDKFDRALVAAKKVA